MPKNTGKPYIETRVGNTTYCGNDPLINALRELAVQKEFNKTGAVEVKKAKAQINDQPKSGKVSGPNA